MRRLRLRAYPVPIATPNPIFTQCFFLFFYFLIIFLFVEGEPMATQDKDRRARVMASELMHVGVYTCMCSRVHAYVANPHSHPKPH